MIARTVISLESADGTEVARWSYRYEDVSGDGNGTVSFAMAHCFATANVELGTHALCVAVINSLTAIARWGDR